MILYTSHDKYNNNDTIFIGTSGNAEPLKSWTLDIDGFNGSQGWLLQCKYSNGQIEF